MEILLDYLVACVGGLIYTPVWILVFFILERLILVYFVVWITFFSIYTLVITNKNFNPTKKSFIYNINYKIYEE